MYKKGRKRRTKMIKVVTIRRMMRRMMTRRMKNRRMMRRVSG